MRVTSSRIHLLTLILSGSLWVSCHGSLDKEDYISWVRNYSNGLHVNQQVGEFAFDVQYQPSDYLWLQKMTTENSEKQQEKNAPSQEIQYYVLTVGLTSKNADFINYGVNDLPGKQRKLYYFSYQFQNDIKLEEGGRQVPCALYHFEKPVDLRGTRTFLLGFERPDKNAQESILIIESEQFGSLPVKIKMSKANIPNLKL